MARALFLVATTAAVTVALPAGAQEWRWNERGWRDIASARVDGRDRDTINLPGRTRQTAIRLCAMNAPLRLRDFDIRFDNGGRQDVTTRAILPAGRCTRAVDLRGNMRDIASVRLRYEPLIRTARRPIVRVQATTQPQAVQAGSVNACHVQNGTRLPSLKLRAVGTEPFWSATIEGRCVTYATPENAGARIWTRFATNNRGSSWSGSLNGRTFELRTTRAGPRGCSDGMSDKVYPQAVTVQLGGETRRGCAETL